MASCFKCSVVDKVGFEAEPIGVCANCHSLTCVDHGTRLRGVPEFKCVFCATADLKTAAGLIVHETYEPPPGGHGGGLHEPAPTEPGPDGGDVVPVLALASHEEFENSISTSRIAELSADHRGQAAETLDSLLELVERFGGDSAQDAMVSDLAATSDEMTRTAVHRAGVRVVHGLTRAVESDRLDRDLLADCIGLGSWAIGERVGAEMSVDRILLIPDLDVQFLLRVTSRYLISETA